MAFVFICNIGDQYDSGISERLPIYQYEEPTDTIFLPANHVLHLELLESDNLYCESKRIKIEELPNLVERHLSQAIEQDTIFFVSLRTNRAASYTNYLSIKDILLAQQVDRLNELSLQKFNEPYSSDMPFAQRKVLRQELELGILEWMPDKGWERLKELRYRW